MGFIIIMVPQITRYNLKVVVTYYKNTHYYDQISTFMFVDKNSHRIYESVGNCTKKIKTPK